MIDETFRSERDVGDFIESARRPVRSRTKRPKRRLASQAGHRSSRSNSRSQADLLHAIEEIESQLHSMAGPRQRGYDADYGLDEDYAPGFGDRRMAQRSHGTDQRTDRPFNPRSTSNQRSARSLSRNTHKDQYASRLERIEEQISRVSSMLNERTQPLNQTRSLHQAGHEMTPQDYTYPSSMDMADDDYENAPSHQLYRRDMRASSQPVQPRARKAAAPRQKPNLDSAIRQIMDRAQSLNGDYAPHPHRAGPDEGRHGRAHDRDDAAIGLLRDEVANLRELLEQANFSGATEQTLNEIATLSSRIDSISTMLGQERSDPKMQDMLRDLHALLDKPAQDPNIDRHFDRILSKLDTMPQANHDAEFARLSEQLDMLRTMLGDAPRAQHFSSLENQIGTLANRLSSLEENVRETHSHKRSGDDGLQDLDYRLQSLQGLLEQLNPSDHLTRLEDQLSSVADRLEHGTDTVRGPLDALAHQVESLTSLVGQQGQASQEKTFAALADRVAELDQRLREGQEAETRFDHVEQTLARIDDMLARQMETSGLSGIEDRLAHLTKQLDQQASKPMDRAPSALDPKALAGLESQISSLADRLDAATKDPYDTAHFEALTDRLDSLAEQFDRSQSRFDAVDRLGQDIQRLAKQPQAGGGTMGSALLDQTKDVAEEAALRALQQIGPLGSSVGDSNLDAILDGLKDDMHGLRNMARAKEDATQEGLHSVSKALNSIVARLASLEDQVRKSEEMPSPAPALSAPNVQMAQAPTAAPVKEEKAERSGLGRLLSRKKKSADAAETTSSAPATTANDGTPLSAQQILAQRAAMGRGQNYQATSTTAQTKAQEQEQAHSAPAPQQAGAATASIAHAHNQGQAQQQMQTQGSAQPHRAPSITLSGKIGGAATAAALAPAAPQVDMEPNVGHAEAIAPQQAAPIARPQSAQIIRDDAGPAPQKTGKGAVSKADFIAAARRAAQAAARESAQAEADRSVAQSFMDRLKGKGKDKDKPNPAESASDTAQPKMNRKQRRAAVAQAAQQANQNKAAPDGALDPMSLLGDDANSVSDHMGHGLDILGPEYEEKVGLFNRIGQAVSRNSRPLLLAAAAILLAITTLQMAKNPDSSLYALFNDPVPQVQSQTGTADASGDVGILNSGNLAPDASLSSPPEATAPAMGLGDTSTEPSVSDAPAPFSGDGSSVTPSSGSLAPDLTGEQVDRAIAFSSASGAQNVPDGPTITAHDAQATSLGPRRPEIIEDQMPAKSQPGMSGDAGIDLTPTSAIERSVIPAMSKSAAQQAMPKQVVGASAPAASAIQSATQMNALLSPGVATSPIMSAAQGGDTLAQFELGRRLTLGDGVSVDMKKAADWFEKAANQSMPQAQYSLANLYEKGHGVKKDLMVARLWYERAAQQGNIKAMHNLAVLYAEGGLGKPDFKQATDWFIKAADHGLKDSQYNLAILFARGMGVKQDLIQSYKWFAIAAHNGDRGAATKRDEVSNVLSHAQKKTAKAIVEAWVPKVAKPSANQVASIPDAWRVKAGAVPGQAGVKMVDPGKPNAAIIRQAQDMLTALGFNTGRPDGQIGPRTRTAIRNFQKSAGLPIDGKLTPALMQALAMRLS